MLRQTFSQPFRAYLVVLVIIFAASTGPIFIRNAQQAGAPSLYIIAARLILTSLILAPIVLKKHGKQLGGLPFEEWLLVAVSGFFFALNLLLLFLALEFTSVLVTSVLRRTTPLWVIWLEMIFLGAIFTRSVWIGLRLTVVGSALVGFGSQGAVEAGSSPYLGALIALVGSVSIGFYLLIGRRFSYHLPALAYSWLVFTVAALLAVLSVMVTATPVVGYSLNVYFWIIVVTIVTQFLGHIPINIGLKFFHATYISILLQVAVVVSAVLAFASFNEIPSSLQLAGSVAIMIGVTIVSLR